MRIPLIPFIILLIAGILVDFYIYLLLKRSKAPRGVVIAHMGIAAVATIGALLIGIAPKKSTDDAGLLLLMWGLFSYLSIYVPKYIFAISALLRAVLSRLFHRQLKGISIAGAVIGILMFGGMWWGALAERFHIDVREVEVNIPNLPKAFDGYRIVQISDIHTGTYGDNPFFLEKVAHTVNELNPDAVFFTGDIVNRHSIELEPFTAVLGTITAPDSVWSIMGNHDYGDYCEWPSADAKQADIEILQRMQSSMGWHMLNNRHTMLHRGNDSIALIGVENIGDPPFHCYGSLGKAYPNLNDSVVKILLSHNPAHWNDSISNNPYANIALTLAGHTHAMQMEIAGLSPAALRYPTWGGLYTDSLGRMLYVNIGIGTVGFPARIGATPEITVITLRP